MEEDEVGGSDAEPPSFLSAALLFLFFAAFLTWVTGVGLVEVWRQGGEGWASLLLPGVFLVGSWAGFVNFLTRYSVRRKATRPGTGSPTGGAASVDESEADAPTPPEGVATPPLRIRVFDEASAPDPSPEGRRFAHQVDGIYRHHLQGLVLRVSVVLGGSLLAVVTGPELGGAGVLAVLAVLFAALLCVGTVRSAGAQSLLGWWILLQLAVLVTSAGMGLSAAATLGRSPSGAAALPVVILVLSWATWLLALRSSVSRTASPGAATDPPTLLVLWAFDEGAADTMQWLSQWIFSAWLAVGPVWQLRGPGWEQYGLTDATRWLSGRTEAVLLDSDAAVRSRLADSPTLPRPGLAVPAYPMEYVTATDDTWKLAVRRLLARADVVLVDLRSFGADSPGVAFELREIVRSVPLERVVLVADDSTGMGHLEAVLEASWQEMPATSPNRRQDPGPVRVYRFSRTLSDVTPDEELTWDLRILGVSLNSRSRTSVGRTFYTAFGGEDAGVVTRLVWDAAGTVPRLQPPDGPGPGSSRSLA